MIQEQPPLFLPHRPAFLFRPLDEGLHSILFRRQRQIYRQQKIRMQTSPQGARSPCGVLLKQGGHFPAQVGQHTGPLAAYSKLNSCSAL